MKGGAIFHWPRFLSALLLVAISLLGLLPFPVHADPSPIGDLLYAKDDITSNTSNKVGVFHNVSFTLPVTAQQITPTDWIFINLPNFTDITTPGEINGAFGNPQYVINNHVLGITNLALLPGNSIEIIGFTATNPSDGFDRQVVISVASDASGTTVRNAATIIASQSSGYIIMSAFVRSPLAAIDLSGFSAPNSFITLDENGTVIGTTSTDTDGSFSFPLTGIDPGDHSYRIYGSDSSDRSTSQAVLELFLLGGTLTSASNILLSPTIQLDKSSLNPGQTLTISGSAKPSSQINVFTESPLRSYTTTSDLNGNWSTTLPSDETTKYTPGEYRAYTNVQDSGGNQSIVSPTLNFSVVSPSTGDNPPPACDISHGDLNCDTKTNLVDFSILLFHWHTDHKVADINNDGSVNLVDFSIMMFYFKR